MARAVIAYDKDLPEIRGRRPWENPTSYLVKDGAAPSGWRAPRWPRPSVPRSGLKALLEAYRPGQGP